MDDTPRPDLVEEVRVRVPLPIVIPAVAVIVIGAVAFGISRILLNVPKNVAVALALVMALNVLGACAYVALKPTRMTSGTWAELFVVLTYPIIIGAVLTQTGVAGTTTGHGEEAHQEAPGGEAAPHPWISATEDQMIAGLIMKVGGGLLLWGIITVIFFRWNAKEQRDEVEPEITWEDFERELEVWDLRK